ncbi:hypothetical protein GCM10025787_01580 [Saccharopolyspora rosea]
MRPRKVASARPGRTPARARGGSAPRDTGTGRGARDVWGPLGMVITVVPVVLVVLRLLVVARFDPTAVKVLLQTLNVAAIATDTVILAVPYATCAALYCAGHLVMRKLEPWVHGLRRTPVFVLAVAAVLFGGYLFISAPVGILAMFFLAGVTFTGLRRNLRTGTPASYDRLHDLLFKTLGWALLGITSAGVLYALSLRMNEMWLPTELVVHKGEKELGYVLQAGDHDTTFMRYDRREIRIIRSDEVDSRSICLPRKDHVAIFSGFPLTASGLDVLTHKLRGEWLDEANISPPVVPLCAEMAAPGKTG